MKYNIEKHIAIIISFVALFISGSALWASLQYYQLSVQPHIVAYAEITSNNQIDLVGTESFLEIGVKNVGLGTATNINMELYLDNEKASQDIYYLFTQHTLLGDQDAHTPPTEVINGFVYNRDSISLSASEYTPVFRVVTMGGQWVKRYVNEENRFVSFHKKKLQRKLVDTIDRMNIKISYNDLYGNSYDQYLDIHIKMDHKFD